MTCPSLSFTELPLGDELLSALQDLGYETPTPIQNQSIPLLIEGHDLLGQAQTGTGKTAAFALPALDRLELDRREPQVLVLAPTRELAIQVAEAFKGYARHLPGFEVATVYGGQSMPLQLRQLKRGVHVVVGTPGRVMDHLRRGTLRLEGIRTVVLDEADEMLKMGFIEDIEWILEHAPEDRQTVLFSATMPPSIKRVAQRHLRDPKEVKIAICAKEQPAVQQYFCKVAGSQKLDALSRILEVEDFDAAIVFVRTKNDTVQIAERLEERGFSTAAINGDMSQPQRERTIERLKAGKVDIVIATDVAARGIDVQRITHVINYDMPYDSEAYTHRIGRTGRAGRSGTAFLFVAPKEVRMFKTIQRHLKRDIDAWELPSAEQISAKRVAQFEKRVADVIAEQGDKLGFFRHVMQQMESRDDLETSDIAAALLYLAQKDRPLRPVLASKPKKAKAKAEERPSNQATDLVKYRMEVGRVHGVTPGDILGAIANEVGLDRADIGHIKLFDEFSTVYLPDEMPKEILRHLRKVRIRQQRTRLSLDTRQSRPPHPRKGPHKHKHKTVRRRSKVS